MWVLPPPKFGLEPDHRLAAASAQPAVAHLRPAVRRQLLVVEGGERGRLPASRADGGQELAHGVEIAQRGARLHLAGEMRSGVARVEGQRDEAPRPAQPLVVAEGGGGHLLPAGADHRTGGRVPYPGLERVRLDPGEGAPHSLVMHGNDPRVAADQGHQ